MRCTPVWIPTILLLVVGVAPARAQIVDTLSGFSQSDPGWHGEVEGALNATGGNTEVVQMAAATRQQWRVGAHLWRAMGAFQRSTNEGEESARNAFAHLRHNAYFTPAVASLAFAQVQENPFQRLRSRLLLGLGVRLEPLRGGDRSLALGLAQMTEIERIEGRRGSEVEQRLSSFLSLSSEIRDGLELDLLIFAQPRWADFADLRATFDLTLVMEIQAPLELTVGAVATHDSRPPEEVEKTDWATKLGFRLSL